MKGDVFPIISKDASGWWEGLSDGRIGWLPSNYVEPLKSGGLQEVLEQAPKTLRINADQARGMMHALAQQEQLVEQRKNEAKEDKKAKRPGGFFKKKKSSTSVDKVSKKPAVVSPRKKTGTTAAPTPAAAAAGASGAEAGKSEKKKGGGKKEMQISGPIAFVHKTHLTGEQVSSSEALLQHTKQLGLTETTATKLIFGEAPGKRPAPPRVAVSVPAPAAAPTTASPPPDEAERPRVYSKQLPQEPDSPEPETSEPPPGDEQQLSQPRVEEEEEEGDELRELRELAAGAAGELAELELLAAAARLPDGDESGGSQAETTAPGEEEPQEADDLARLLEAAEQSMVLETLNLLEGIGIGEVDVSDKKRATVKYPLKPPPPPPV